MTEKAEAFWQAFLDLGDHRERYGSAVPDVWHFCSNKEDADDLLALVLQGPKRGTASLIESYERDGEEIPEVGCLSIVTDWAGNPGCVIETVKITRCPFGEVTEEMAAIEGEGDGSLSYWRRAHINAFGEEMKDWGKTLSDDMEILFEEFRVLYP